MIMNGVFELRLLADY